MVAMLALLTPGLVLPHGRHANVHIASMAQRTSRAALTRMTLPSDADLFASLRKRTESSPDDASQLPPPLGPDEVGAESMGPADVVSYCMRAMKADQGNEFPGLKVLMSFAVRFEDGKPEDTLGQVQPGHFSAPAELADYLGGNARYQTLLELSEWKPMGAPDFSNMSRSAVQKLLVRREGGNWEDLFINMQLASLDSSDAMANRRWLITTIYKQGTP